MEEMEANLPLRTLEIFYQKPRYPWKEEKRGRFQESKPEAAEVELTGASIPPRLRLQKMAKTYFPVAFHVARARCLYVKQAGVSLKQQHPPPPLASPDVHLFETNTWSHVDSAPT